MLTIALHQTHRRLRKLLVQGAAPYPALHVKTNHIALEGGLQGLILVSSTESLSLSCDKAVLVARQASEIPKSLDCAHVVAVIDSSNPALREAIAVRKIPALTCGRSDTDTFTLTSLTNDSAVISLGRQICAFDQTLVEPFELPVVLSEPIDPFDLLACAAVLCLLGQDSPLILQKKWSPFAVPIQLQK